MGTILRFLIITAAIIIPWAVIRIANLEIEVADAIRNFRLSDIEIVGLLLIPLLTMTLAKWLFGPISKKSKRYSTNNNIMIKFRG